MEGLVDLHVTFQADLYPDGDVLVGLIGAARGLRRLEVIMAEGELIGRLAGVMGGGVERLGLFNVRLNLRGDDVVRLVRRCEKLEYLTLVDVRLSWGDWREILAKWADELKRLKDVGISQLYHLPRTSEGRRPLVFNGLLDWDGAPAGDLEFCLDPGGDAYGARYCGDEVGTVLKQIAEVQSGEMGSRHGATRAGELFTKKELRQGFLVGGKLRAKRGKTPLYTTPDVLDDTFPAARI